MSAKQGENEEQGSMVSHDEVPESKTRQPQTPKDSTEPLFQRLDRIAKAVEAQAVSSSSANIAITAMKETVVKLDKTIAENTTALNSLLTTFLMKDEKPVPQTPERQTSSVSITSVTSVTPPVTPPLPPSTASSPKSDSLETAKTLFPDEIANLLSFEDKEDYIVVKPRQFLGSENFSKIASIVRQAGGEYVSAGKASHFRVPKSKK